MTVAENLQWIDIELGYGRECQQARLAYQQGNVTAAEYFTACDIADLHRIARLAEL